jgi:hypothetical protein
MIMVVYRVRDSEGTSRYVSLHVFLPETTVKFSEEFVC